MSLSPDDLYDVAIRSEDYDSLDHNCAAHDIALYQIDVFQDYPSFKFQLKDSYDGYYRLGKKEYAFNGFLEPKKTCRKKIENKDYLGVLL